MDHEFFEGKLGRKLTDSEGYAVHYWNINGYGITPEKWEEVKMDYKALCAKAGIKPDGTPIDGEKG
ncbi:MAG: hypothetical protein HZA01_04940 [Nitrospinae bacterium]|nr:hypothetical protein [Nitrospinota bacterium]